MLRRLCKLPPRNSCLLFGARQTGKTTLVRSVLPAGSWSVDLLHHETALRYTTDPGAFHREALRAIRDGAPAVFIDEVQRAPHILDSVHSLIEETRARFVMTGSSARKLRRGGANLLAGRAALRRLHPLTARELGDEFDLERALLHGTLPGIVADGGDDAVERLRAYAEVYLREEIQAEALVRNVPGFARFLDVAAAQSGDIVNFAAVARDAAISARTVQEYFQILEDTLVGVRLEPWRRSPRARLVGHPRFYFFDTGVTNAFNRRLTARPDPVLRGRLFEQWMVTECHRLADYLYPETRLFYWRTHHGAEVDLLFERHGRLVVAVEISSKARIAGADVGGLRSFHEEHPDVPRVTACLTPNAFDLDGIEVLPYRRFLDELDRWL